MTGTRIDPRHSSSPCSIVVYLNRHLALSLTVTFNMQHLPSPSLPPLLLPLLLFYSDPIIIIVIILSFPYIFHPISPSLI